MKITVKQINTARWLY